MSRKGYRRKLMRLERDGEEGKGEEKEGKGRKGKDGRKVLFVEENLF